MSGGEQQQLAIGRALIGNPVLMLLDQPSEGIQLYRADDLRRVAVVLREIGTTILLVEQNLDTILAISGRCYAMEKGALSPHGTGAGGLRGSPPAFDALTPIRALPRRPGPLA